MSTYNTRATPRGPTPFGTEEALRRRATQILRPTTHSAAQR
jgi:hypothetical protein